MLQASSWAHDDSGYSSLVRTWLIIVGLVLASFVDRSTSTATGSVLPYIQGDLAISGDQAPLITLSFNGAYYVGILLGPRIMLRLGRIRYLIACTVVYGIASLLCAMSHSFPELVACRVLLGLAEGGFFLAGLLTIFTNVPANVVPYYILAYGAITQCASAVAPLMAGAIVDGGSWRILYVALAITALSAAAMIHASSEESAFDVALEDQGRETGTDFVGIALLVIAVGAYSYLSGYGEQRDWLNSADVATAFALFLAAGLAFVCWEVFGTRHPLVPRGIVTRRNAWLGLALGLGIGFPLYGVTELLRYLQGSLNFPLWLAGSVIALRGLALLIAAPLGNILMARGIDSRYIIASGFGISMLAFLWESSGVTSGAEFNTFVGAELLVGAGFGLTFSPLLLTVISNVGFAEIPFALAVMNLSFVSAGSFANAWLSTIFDHRLQQHVSDLAATITLSRSAIQGAVRSGGPAFVHTLGALVAQQAAVLAFADVAICSAGVAALAIPLAFLLRPAQPMPNVQPAAAATATSPQEAHRDR
jgi:MFS transporter, DHA2 family, multidrug resistance protein